MVEIVPGIQSNNLLEVQHKINLLAGLVTHVHIDICDGEFVSSQTISAADIRLLRPRVPFSLHLMAQLSEEVVIDYATTDTTTLFFYPRAAADPDSIIDLVHDFGKKAGLVIDLDDSVSGVKPYLSKIDDLLIMTVRSGFSGQKFHPEALGKVKELKRITGNKIRIGVDGGIRLNNIALVAKSGASFLVANSAVWQTEDVKFAITRLKEAVSD